MNRKRAICCIVLFSIGSLVSACAMDGAEPEGAGAADVTVQALPLALADIAEVRITVSGPRISPPIVQTLSGNAITGWSGTINDIPAGVDREFLAEAFDGSATPVLIYQGVASPVTIVEGPPALVTIFMQQMMAPMPFSNAAPRITGLTVSAYTVVPDGTISLSVTASDPDLETLTYQWSATGGSFDDATIANPVWIASGTAGFETLTIDVNDPSGATATLDIGITVASTPGPLRVSSTNPRYFEDASGNIVYLAGSHTWLNLHDGLLTDPPPGFDYTAWLDFLEQHNHNFFRLWAWEQATWMANAPVRWNFGLRRYHRTGPGNALDGKPKFDLTKLDQQYFDRLRQRVIEAGQRGMWVSVMLFNGWSVEFPKGGVSESNPWHGHPYNAANNINGIDGDVNGDDSGSETHELGNVAVTELQEAFVRKVIDTINDLDNVLYEISNESHSGSLQWQYHMIDLVKSYEAGKPKQHPVGLTVPWPNGQNSALLASDADWVSLNGGLDDPPTASGTKVIVSDTDHLCGICGHRQWAWKSFTRGENPIFMDPYIDVYDILDYDLNNPQDVSLRRNLGYTRSYANRMDLGSMVPRGELSSTGYALASTGGPHDEYLIYAPNGGTITVDLSATPVELSVEWFNPASGQVSMGTPIVGGSSGQLFQSPFSTNDTVLYLRAGTNP